MACGSQSCPMVSFRETFSPLDTHQRSCKKLFISKRESANCTVLLCFVVCSPLVFPDVMSIAVFDLSMFVSMDTVTARHAHLWLLFRSDRNDSRFAVFPS